MTVKNRFPEKDIWLYTGYDFNNIFKLYENIINNLAFPRNSDKQYAFYL